MPLHAILALCWKPTEKPSFPSDHTIESTAVAWGMHNGPLPLTEPLMILAALVGVSRVYVGKHHPSDVVSGALIANACDSACDSLAGRIPQLSTDSKTGPQPDD